MKKVRFFIKDVLVWQNKETETTSYDIMIPISFVNYKEITNSNLTETLSQFNIKINLHTAALVKRMQRNTIHRSYSIRSILIC